MSLLTLTLFLITWLIQAAHTFKDIPDLKALGYDVYGLTPASGDWKNNEKPGIMAVFNAQTADDNRPERLPLRDIMLGVWVHFVGRDPADLFVIQYRNVYADDHVEATHRVIFRDHDSDDEEEAYDLLHDETAFGAGAQKMLDEFTEMQGKKVEAFGYDAQAPSVFHLTTYFWI